MKTPTWITASLLEELSREAVESPRLRRNRNFHEMSEPAHRLLNALAPGTYIRPHRHLDPDKAETAIAIAGAVGVIVFDDSGEVLEARRLSPEGPIRGCDTPPGVWHTFVALEPHTVFFEAKAGPFTPLGPDEIAAWAPEEGSPGAAGALRSWRALFPPDPE